MTNEKIHRELNENGSGKLSVKENGEELGLMEIEISETAVTARHTEVFPAAEGKGLGKKLFMALVELAREKKLQIMPLCPFVHAQLRRMKEEVKDVWQGD